MMRHKRIRVSVCHPETGDTYTKAMENLIELFFRETENKNKQTSNNVNP